MYKECWIQRLWVYCCCDSQLSLPQKTGPSWPIIYNHSSKWKLIDICFLKLLKSTLLRPLYFKKKIDYNYVILMFHKLICCCWSMDWYSLSWIDVLIEKAFLMLPIWGEGMSTACLVEGIILWLQNWLLIPHVIQTNAVEINEGSVWTWLMYRLGGL